MTLLRQCLTVPFRRSAHVCPVPAPRLPSFSLRSRIQSTAGRARVDSGGRGLGQDAGADPAHRGAAGTDESAEFLRHNKLIQQAWGRKVVPVCETIPGRNHFSVLEDLTAPWEHLHQPAIRRVFGKV
jgi:hypothetical protein